ncbi:MAG: transporter [Nocardioides sp.]|nr:transporter [Nocardioides sp.]
MSRSTLAPPEVAVRTGRRSFLRPDVRREVAIAIGIVLVAVAVPIIAGNSYWLQAILLATVYVIAASGLNILRAQAEQLSFGQGAVMGVAAYTTALAVAAWEYPLPVAVLLGFLAGMAAGMILALPSLRVQGYYLGFVTMAGALALPEIFFLFEEQTRAVTGVNVPPSAIRDVVFWRTEWLTLVIVAFAIAALVVAGMVKSSRFGRQLKVAGTSPEAAMTLGLRPGRLRLQAFAVASLMASVAGVLYVLLIQYVAPGSFTLALSILLYFVVVIGGAGTIVGPLLGVGILYLVPDVALASLVDYRLLIYGVTAFVIMFLMPDGIAGGLRRLLHRLRGRTAPVVTISLREVLAQAPEAGEDGNASGPDAPPGPLLRAEGLAARFGQVQALDGIDLEIGRKEIHAIVGPNGSGKTTLLNAISGLVAVDSGTVFFDGRDVSSIGASGRARLGLARTFQTPRVFADMTVWENVDCGAADGGTHWFAKALEAVREQWDRLPAATLPHGQRRFLEVARALRRGPVLIALDEPAAGLSVAERKEFSSLLRSVVAATGASVLMVEHDLELVWGTADRISVVDAGRVVVSGPPAEIRHLPEISRLFAGVNHVAG